MKVAVDVGGTFTDVAHWDGTRLRVGKVPTSPDQSDGVVAAIGLVGATGSGLLHGTTAATNAVLERAGARLALITDDGFQDLVEIGRQDRPSLYDVDVTRPEPLVPPERRFGLPGRGGPQGGTGDGVPAELIDAIAATDPQAVAISLLYAFADDARERMVAEAVATRLGVPVSRSSEVAPEIREFERCSTTLLNAYVTPRTTGYLRTLASRVTGSGEDAPAVMRSSGGLISLDEAARLPASILLSGPAGGVVAAGALGNALGHDTVISFDMGGTSTDVCRIEHGRPEVVYQRSIDGFPSTMPTVAIHTVGAGGGSVAWIDVGGALRVGPMSAGAHPGPACYGLGGERATVTDADLIVGRIGTESPLGGALVPDGTASRRVLASLGDALGLDAAAAARGVIEVVEAHMERAVRKVSVDEGSDPRGAVLVAFGGAGGLHASALARRLDMAAVVVPAHAGVFSAFGLLLAPRRLDVGRSVLLDGLTGLREAADAVATEARSALGVPGSISVLVDLRYRGQSHETTVPYRSGEPESMVLDRFHAAHRRRNGFSRPGDPVEVVTVRAEAVGTPALRWDEVGFTPDGGEPRRADRPVLTGDGEVGAAVWWRPALRPGSEIVGPAVVEESEATTYLGPGERATVHESGALEVTW